MRIFYFDYQLLSYCWLPAFQCCYMHRSCATPLQLHYRRGMQDLVLKNAESMFRVCRSSLTPSNAAPASGVGTLGALASRSMALKSSAAAPAGAVSKNSPSSSEGSPPITALRSSANTCSSG